MAETRKAPWHLWVVGVVSLLGALGNLIYGKFVSSPPELPPNSPRWPICPT